jgi:hypothetical protein
MFAISVVYPAGAVVDELLDVYHVKSINIDVTDKTASKAREKAMDIGVNRALNKVFNRLVTRFDRVRLPQLDAKAKMDLVQELTVVKEKNSPVRYIATIEVTFKADEINNILSSNSIPFVQSKSKKIMVLPVLNQSANSESLLWENSNVWHKMWAITPPDSVIVPVYVPSFEEGEEPKNISVENAKNAVFPNLQEIKDEYGVEEVFVVKATYFSEIDPRVEVEIKKAGVGYSEVVPGFSVPQEQEEEMLTLLARAENKAMEEIEEAWKQNQVVQFDASSEMIVLIPTGSLKQWVKMKNMFLNMPLVNKFKLQAMKKDRAQVKLSFSGSVNRFARELSKKNLIIETMGSYWIIRDKNIPSSLMQ